MSCTLHVYQITPLQSGSVSFPLIFSQIVSSYLECWLWWAYPKYYTTFFSSRKSHCTGRSWLLEIQVLTHSQETLASASSGIPAQTQQGSTTAHGTESWWRLWRCSEIVLRHVSGREWSTWRIPKFEYEAKMCPWDHVRYTWSQFKAMSRTHAIDYHFVFVIRTNFQWYSRTCYLQVTPVFLVFFFPFGFFGSGEGLLLFLKETRVLIQPNSIFIIYLFMH